MNIYARITRKSKELSIEEAKLLVKYAYVKTDKEEKDAIKKEVFSILERIFPDIQDGTEDSYIPGSWLQYVAYDLGMQNNCCNDINL